MKKPLLIGLVILVFLGIGVMLLGYNINKNYYTTSIIPTSTHINDEVLTTPTQAQSNDMVDFTASKEVKVVIKNFEYVPKKIRIQAGTTVTWTNEDDMKHNVMLDHEDSDKPHDAKLGDDPSKFEGPLLAKGESYSFTFLNSSNNPYHCSPHPWMKGQVEVIQ